MTPRTARWALFLAGLFLVPIPIPLPMPAFIPTMRVLELAAIVAVTIFLEGAAGVALSILGILVLEAAIAAALLWLVAAGLLRLLERAGPTFVGWGTVGLIAVAAFVAIVWPIYDTPFHATLPHATLREVYE